MAGLERKLSGEGDELPRCSTLFVTEDGSQMNFYMTPCAMKTRLRPLIHHGGGDLSSKVLADSIKLASPGTGNNLPGYISSDYIFDSIKHNRLQDLEKYSMKSLEASAHVTSSISNGKSTSSNRAISPPSGIKERQSYTIEEDCALIKFVNENEYYYPVKGSKLYKRAEKAKITGHTWQSMRNHYLRVLQKKKHADIFLKASTWKGFVVTGEKKNIRREESDDPSTHNVTVGKDQDSRPTGEASREKAKKGDTDKHVATDDTDDSNADQEKRPADETTRLKAKIVDRDKHVATDDRDDPNADCLPDEARADIADDENSTEHEDVDYDKIFDDNLLKQAYEYKKRRDSSAVENDVTDNEDGDEESTVSSSQEIGNRVVTRNVKRPMNEQEELTDFDGEIVFRKELKSPSPKKSHLEDMEDSKKPMAKRSKRDLESLPDDENPSERDRKLREAFFQYCHTLQSSLQKLECELTVPQIIHGFLVSSGFLEDTVDYFQNGPGKELWTSKEDKILLSKNKDDISRLSKKRGVNAVIDRMNFMEGIN